MSYEIKSINKDSINYTDCFTHYCVDVDNNKIKKLRECELDGVVNDEGKERKIKVFYYVDGDGNLFPKSSVIESLSFSGLTSENKSTYKNILKKEFDSIMDKLEDTSPNFSDIHDIIYSMSGHMRALEKTLIIINQEIDKNE